MFTNREVREYAHLLETLNHDDDREFPEDYLIVKQGGGKDGIPHYKLLKNESKREYIIWIRGTRFFFDPNDISINIVTRPYQIYGGFIHTGYFLAALKVIHLIQNRLNDPQINKIVCIGHSLGAAVSSVITTILQKGLNLPDFQIDAIQRRFTRANIKGLVFASPPVFSSNICIETRNYITNIILANDIVPKIRGLFDAFTTLDRMIVTYLFVMNNGLSFNMNVNTLDIIVRRYALFVVNPDRIPGNVIILDPSTEAIDQGSNIRVANSVIEYLGIINHAFSNYYRAILELIRDEEINIEDNIGSNSVSDLESDLSNQYYYVNTDVTDHPSYEEINLDHTNIDSVVFRKPLKYVYSTSSVLQLVDSLACFDALYRNLPDEEKNSPAQQRLTLISKLFYYFAAIESNKKFPRDVIESYSLCYSIFGNGPVTLDQIKYKFEQTAQSIMGSRLLILICFPVNLTNRENLKVSMNAVVNGNPYNAYLKAYIPQHGFMTNPREMFILLSSAYAGSITRPITTITNATLSQLRIRDIPSRFFSFITSPIIGSYIGMANGIERVLRIRQDNENHYESYFND